MKAMTCDYCHCALSEGAAKCSNCGAPAAHAGVADYRNCPHCKRRLLALGSPACNYCGRPLPESYVKAREAMRQRIDALSAGNIGEDEREELESAGDDPLRRALRALFKLDADSRRD